MEAAWAHGYLQPAQAFRQVAYEATLEAFPALGAIAKSLEARKLLVAGSWKPGSCWWQDAAMHLQTAGSQEAAGGCSGYWLLARTTVEAEAAASYSGYRLLDMSFVN